MKKNLSKKIGIYALYGTMIASLVGCNKKNEEKKTFDGKLSTQVQREFEENSNKLGEPNFDLNLYPLESMNTDYLKDYYDTSNMYKYDKKCNTVEFGKEMGYSNITYEDVLEVLDTNSKSDLNIKKTLYKAIYGLVENGFYSDLSILYYTMANVRVKEVENVDYDAFYDPITCCVYINKEAENKEYLLIREAIGNGFKTAYVKGEKNIFASFTDYYLYLPNDGSNPEIRLYGKDIDRAISSMIANIAMNKEIEDYSDCEKAYVAMILTDEFNGITLEELVNYGFRGLVQAMFDNGNNEMLNYLTKYENDNFGALMDMLKVHIRHLYENGYTRDEILAMIEETSNCYIGKLKISTNANNMFPGWGDASPMMVKINAEYDADMYINQNKKTRQ